MSKTFPSRDTALTILVWVAIFGFITLLSIDDHVPERQGTTEE